MADEMARNGSMKSMDARDDEKVTDQPDVPVGTAHQISTDSWYQVAFVLTTGVLSAYVLGYPGTVMVPLGWIPGVIGLILATLVSLYANVLVARLHEFGGQRHIRYRDLAGFIYGEKAYYITWALQYVNLYLINVGFIILAGHSLKAIYVLFRSDDVLRLPHFIAIAGFACAVFAISVPHLSAMRVWLGFSALFSAIYIFVGVWLSIIDGKRTPAKDYSIQVQGSDRVYVTIGACANLVFSFNTGMLPEIQATVRQPVVSNTMKALIFQFTIGVVPMYLLIFAAYWAYGSGTSDYLLANVHGPTTVKALASLAAFLQSVISLHIFASPMYEYLDTAFNISGEVMNPRNLAFRIVVRGGYVAVTAFVSAMLPFLGAFMSLTGAVSTFPLTFILAHHMYLKAKGDKLSRQQKQWHWANVAFFCAMAVASFVAAIKEIARASKHFNIFANL